MKFKLDTMALVIWVLALFAAAAAPAPAAGPAEGLESPEDLLRALARQGGDVALVSYTVDDDGGIDRSDPVLMHNPDQPMVLASTIKIVVLAAYAREVVAGRLDPQEPVALGDWDSYHLPFLNGGAHVASLEELGVATDPFGFALEPETEVPLDALVRAMIRHSDNAAPDLLLDRLGREKMSATIDALGMTVQELPLSSLGLFLTLGNPDFPELSDERLESLLALGPRGYAAEVDRLAARYRSDPAWREEILEALASGEVDLDQPNVRRLIRARFPKGSAREYARLLGRLVSGTLISPEFEAVLRRHLEWPLSLPGVPDFFATLGAKGGSLPPARVLTRASYFIPLVLDFAGKPRVSVVFLRDLDDDLYLQLLQNVEIFPTVPPVPVFDSYVLLLGTSLDFLELTEEILCIADDATLCLNGGRFRVRLVWENFEGVTGNGRTVTARTDDSGLFYFFGRDNWEVLVKVLDGCSFNGRYWVFSAAVSNLGYRMTVTDTATGTSREYVNFLGDAAPAVTDVTAFAACP